MRCTLSILTERSQWQPDSEHTHKQRGHELPKEDRQKRDNEFDEELGHGKDMLTPKAKDTNILWRVLAKNPHYAHHAPCGG